MGPDNNPGIENGQQGQPNRAEQEAQRQWEQYALQGRLRSTEFGDFAERMRPSEVRHDASKLREFWLDQWFRRGEPPYSFIAENGIRRAAARVEQLTDSLPSGFYEPNEIEKQAGLVECTLQQPVTINLFKDKRFEIKLDEQDEQGRDVVSYDGVKIGHLESNVDEIAYLQSRGVDTTGMRTVFYVVKEVSAEQAAENRERLAEEIRIQQRQTEAWHNLLMKVNEQDIFSSDLDAYVDQEFTRLGKVVMRGRMYGEIFNGPPTREGLAPFGKKEIVALRAWREVVEERAYAKLVFKDPTPNNPNNTTEIEGMVPNPFAYPKNQRLLELALDYVQARVNKECPLGMDEKGNISTSVWDKNTTEANKKDNKAAALGGLLLVDHFDIDAHSAVQVVTKSNSQGQQERDLNFEIAFVDSTKILHPRTRRMNEFLGITEEVPDNKRRPHPREAGSPISLRFLPNLGSNFLEEVTVYTTAKHVDDEGKLETKKIRVTLDQISEGSRKNGGQREVQTDQDGKKYSRICIASDSANKKASDYWQYELRPLSDRSLWDEITVVGSSGEGGNNHTFMEDEKGRGGVVDLEVKTKEEYTAQGQPTPKIFEFNMGTNSLPYEVPKGLLERYALTKVFKEFTRTDYENMYKQYTNAQYLQSLNKGISLAMVLLSTQYQLSKDTQRDLEEFIRISLLANCAGALIKGTDIKNGKDIEKGQQVAGPGVLKSAIIPAIENAALVSGFLLTKEGGGWGRDWERGKDKLLFNEIIERRKEAPLSPFSFQYFNNSQREELKPLYQ